MTVFYLVRHAHAEWTPDENRSLSTQGLKDADRVADALQTIPITVIYSSPFLRARQTVAGLAARLNTSIQLERDLRERRLGDGANHDFFQAVEVTWRDPSFAFPGGESNDAAQQRGKDVLRRLHRQHPAENVVLSTHGNLLALILQSFDPTVGYSFWKSLTMPDIYRINVGRNGRAVFARMWGETGS